MNKAMYDWEVLGHKHEVEECQAIFSKLKTRMSLNKKGEDYLNEIRRYEKADTTGISGLDFCETSFSPNDAFKKKTEWKSLTLTKEEFSVLTQDAPESLKSFFGAVGKTDDTIEQISLEYNDVVLIRGWFDPMYPGFFESRYWRDHNNRRISGHESLIPAYISRILAVRNIRITRKKAMPDQPINFSTSGAVLQTQLPEFSQGQSLDVTTQQALNDTIHVNEKFRGRTIETPSVVIPPKKSDLLTSASGELVSEFYDWDGINVLAYLCKRLPASPNPDETLIWNGE
jgi:hypothetical protein